MIYEAFFLNDEGKVVQHNKFKCKLSRTGMAFIEETVRDNSHMVCGKLSGTRSSDHYVDGKWSKKGDKYYAILNRSRVAA